MCTKLRCSQKHCKGESSTGTEQLSGYHTSITCFHTCRPIASSQMPLLHYRIRFLNSPMKPYIFLKMLSGFQNAVSMLSFHFRYIKVTEANCFNLQVIDALLDTDRIPRKPQYSMAPEIPLVLQSCEFEGLNFTCSSGTFFDTSYALFVSY